MDLELEAVHTLVTDTGLGFPICERGGGLTCLAQGSLQGCKTLSPSGKVGGESRAGVVNAG